jgi:hypothetical protein
MGDVMPSISLRFAAVAVFIGLFSVAPAQAEISKFIKPCGTQDQKVKLCPSFRASITIPDGWVQDKEASAYFDAQFLLPQGVEFGKAPAKIYVVVAFNREKKPLADFLPDGLADWKGRAKDGNITELADFQRSDGKPAFVRRQFEGRSLKEQGYEFQSVTTDDDKDGNQFIVTITLSADSPEAFKAATPAYLAILSKY